MPSMEWPFVSFQALKLCPLRKKLGEATIWPLKQLISHKTAIFRQVNKK